MKKDRCPEYFPIFWLMQWLKKCTIYWDRTQEEGWLWRSVCVCRVCKRGEERYTLFSYRHVNLETCMRCLRTGNIKLLNLWACCLELGPHPFTSRSYWSWETLTLNGHIWGDKPEGNSKRRNESDRKKRRGKKKVGGEVKCCWEINNKEDWKMLFDKMYFGAELMWSRTGVVWRVSKKRRQGNLDVNRSFLTSGCEWQQTSVRMNVRARDFKGPHTIETFEPQDMHFTNCIFFSF